jgi:hypothetical protein
MQSLSNINKGFGGARVFTFEDFDAKFISLNRETLEFERGAGYWLWKPYILLKLCGELKPKNIIMYCDAGVVPRMSAEFYTKLAKDDLIHLWEIEGSILEDWTEPATLDSLGITQDLRTSPLVMAGALLSTNTFLLSKFAEEWLALASKPELLRPDSFPDYKKPASIFWHRHDQSLLTILTVKHPEWFHIHSTDSSATSAFDVHRNTKPKYLFVTFSFPTFRKLRRKIVSKLPRSISSRLRKLLHLMKTKPVTKEETDSILKHL